MDTVRLTSSDLAPDADTLEGHSLDARHYDRVVRDSVTVLKPDGSPLLIYVKDALPKDLCRAAFRVFGSAHLVTNNRGLAAGAPRRRKLKRDGSRTRSTYGRAVNSGTVGFLDRNGRFPYCSMTAFNLDHHREFERARPLAVAVSEQFRILAPARWQAQRDFLAEVPQNFVIRDTVFTTITVNRTWRTAAHRDERDYRPGFGVLAAIEGGSYQGGELIFPKYRTAVDLRTGGLCLADVHELHGNAPMWGEHFTRLSLVFYAREGMRECGTPTQERDRANRLSGSLL